MSNRVAIFADFENSLYDQRNSSLLALVDTAHVFSYPNISGGDKNSVAGRDGDKFLIQVPFLVQNAASNGVTPLLGKVTMSVVATKTGLTDFILETKTFDASTTCTSGGVQNPSFTDTRNYQTFAGDPFNTYSLIRSTAYDTGTMKGFMMQYPLTLRYDYWNSILPVVPGTSTGTCQNNINNDIANVNNVWSNLATNGWSLVVKFFGNVKGYDGFITIFEFDIPVTCQPMGSPSLTGPNYVNSVLFYDANPNSATYGQLVNGILPGSQTRVSMTFTPDATPVPGGYDGYSGMMFIDMLSGGVTSRRLGSTEIPAESGSPWSPAPQITGPPPSDIYYTGGISMNIFNTTGVVIIEGIYDDTVLNWSQKASNLIVSGSIALKDDALQTDGGIDIQTDGGTTILKDS